jgi:uncharacterized protein YndB with AHSA1/START domain
MTAPLPDVTLVRIIPASPRVVFEAWLDPAVLRKFMCPAQGSSVLRTEVDARVGGKFLIVMKVGDQELPHQGEYLEIAPHERLAFTWRSWVAGEGSRVSLTFAPSPNGQTQLTLQHSGLGDAENCARHTQGWTHILAQIAGAV